jgi:hypothetical protein
MRHTVLYWLECDGMQVLAAVVCTGNCGGGHEYNMARKECKDRRLEKLFMVAGS